MSQFSLTFMKLRHLFLFLLGVSAPVISVAEYWVSVASFKNRDSAESALVSAQAQSEQPFSVFGARTDKGYFFRVIAGPYLSRSEAKTAQRVMASEGLSGGWIWGVGATGTDPKPSNVEGGRDLRGTQNRGDSGEVDFSVSEDDWSNEFDFDESLDFGPQDPLLPKAKSSQELLPQIQQTVPEGYQLNKLRREARAPPNLQHMYLAVALSQTRPKLPSPQAPEPEVTSRTEDAGTTHSTNNSVHLSVDMPVALPRRKAVPEGFAVDGKLDECIWATLLGADGFLVDDPDTLAEPIYRTVVKAFYTDKGLYVGIDMEQPNDTLVRRLSSRDALYIRRDRVGVSLDTSGEGRYGYWINVALGGSQSDGTLLPERQFSRDWDGAWYSGTSDHR